MSEGIPKLLQETNHVASLQNWSADEISTIVCVYLLELTS